MKMDNSVWTVATGTNFIANTVSNALSKFPNRNAAGCHRRGQRCNTNPMYAAPDLNKSSRVVKKPTLLNSASITSNTITASEGAAASVMKSSKWM